MRNNYDPVAKYYDRIHHLLYGQAEISAQVELLNYVRPGDRLLIVGGGTGWILEKIAAIFPAGLEITYIESSGRMMELAKKRTWGQNKVELVMSGVEEWSGEAEYDCILTGLFFDNFKEPHAAAIVRQLTPFLKRGGYWLESDFYYPKKKGKVMAGDPVVDHVYFGATDLRGGGEAITRHGSDLWGRGIWGRVYHIPLSTVYSRDSISADVTTESSEVLGWDSLCIGSGQWVSGVALI